MLKHNVFRTGSWLILLGLLVLAAVIFGAGWKASGVLAQAGGTSSEPGASVPLVDEGYTTRLALASPQAQARPASPSEPGASALPAGGVGSDRRPVTAAPAQAGPAGLSEPGASAIPAGGAGADRRPLTAAQAAAAPTVWPTNWFTVIGATFTPSNTTTTYTYGLHGCVQPTAAGQWRASIFLPDGSVLKYIYINYRNTATSVASSSWLTAYKYDGTNSDLVGLSTRGGSVTGAGYFSDLSSEITQPVDNLNYGYAVVWDGSTTQVLCSIQVGFIPPLRFYTNMPTLIR